MNNSRGPSSHDQDFFEHRMSRPELFAAHDGGLVAIHPGDKEYATFSTHGADAFESVYPEPQSVVLERCRSCHSDSGIHSVQSRLQWMNGSGERDEDPIAWETHVTIEEKQRQPEFRLLQRLWAELAR